MTNYIIRRVITAIVIIFIVSILVFFVLRSLPGDPVLMYMSVEQMQSLSPEQIADFKKEFGLDKPLIVQYVNWVNGILHGDLGKSMFYRTDIKNLILHRLPITLHIGLISFIISFLLGVTAGVISALRRGKIIDSFVTILANTGITMPIFWMGILLIYVFGYKLHWLPICGYTSPFDNFWISTKQVIMPIVCLSIFPVGAIARQTRSSILEVTRQDYIRTAWSKGLSERALVIKHVLKNGLIPIVTLAGMQLSQILGGSVLIEKVFNIPGIGRLVVDAVMSLDYSIVQAVILMTATMVVLANLLVDISYGWLDPRISYE
jgi:peptide/nickel transport system permease protein